MRTDGIEVRESLLLRSSQAHCVFDLVYYLRHLLHLAFKIAFFQKVFRNLLDLDVVRQHHIRLNLRAVDQERLTFGKTRGQRFYISSVNKLCGDVYKRQL